MWNVFANKYKLWINWIHMYYLEKEEVAMYIPKVHCSWIIKAMFKYRDVIMDSAFWAIFQTLVVIKPNEYTKCLEDPSLRLPGETFFTVTLRGQERHLLAGWHVRIGCPQRIDYSYLGL